MIQRSAGSISSASPMTASGHSSGGRGFGGGGGFRPSGGGGLGGGGFRPDNPNSRGGLGGRMPSSRSSGHSSGGRSPFYGYGQMTPQTPRGGCMGPMFAGVALVLILLLCCCASQFTSCFAPSGISNMGMTDTGTFY